MISWRSGIMRGDKKFYLLLYTFLGCFVFYKKHILLSQ